MSRWQDGPDMDAVLLAAAVLLASGGYTTREAITAARCLRAELRCQTREEGADERPF